MAVAAMRAFSQDDHAERQESEDAGLEAATPFILSGADETRVGLGVGASLPPTPAAGLKDAVNAFWAAQAHARPHAPMLVGVLPFDRTAPAHLYAPQTVADVWPARAAAATAEPAQGQWSSAAEPAPAAYAEAVERALALLSGPSGLRKVVLARSLMVTAPAEIDTDTVLSRLARDPSIATYAVPLPTAAGAPARTLIGATPELLVDKRGLAVRSAPLAGSARRHADRDADEASAAGLLNSQKDRREHAFVVEAILDTLAPYCRDLKAPSGPSLVSTASMWHLGTLIDGTLKDKDVSAVELAAALHPTPAVCGLPREAARQAIAALENIERGYYAGAVGWADRNGDGRWMVAIRCAEFSGRTARVYAGAGIVPGSDPWSEVAETSAKFTALLAALGIDEAGGAGRTDAEQETGQEGTGDRT
ncbi:isochorismate synthase [Pseudochelatococcus sp. B33]